MIARVGLGLSLTIIRTVMLPLLLLPSAVEALDLSDALVDSISAHPEVKEKIHVYRQILKDQDIAESGWRPSVDLEASTGVYNTESPTTGNQSIDYESSSVELSLTQNLFNGYDTTNQIEQSQARATAALYDIYDTADNIALRAIQAYMETLKQRRLLQLATENVANHQDILSRIRDRNLSGVGRRSQLQQTEGRLARAQASLIAQVNNLADAISQLHQILGRYVDPDSLSDPDLPAFPEDSLDDLIDQALANHPAMRVAQSNVEAAQSEHRRSLRTRYPNIDLRLATEYGDNIGGLSGTTEETSLVLNLSYNFYRGGSNSAEHQKRISAIYEQKEFAARVRRQIINTLRLSFNADELLAQQLIFLEDHVIKAGETVESYGEEFFIGQRDLIDLLDAENELNSARNQFTVAQYDSLSARYRIFEGVGQLFSAANVDFQFEQGNLKIARLSIDEVDHLPLPDDEDSDHKNDNFDHCDNSLPGATVNPYGCLESIEVLVEMPEIPAEESLPVEPPPPPVIEPEPLPRFNSAPVTSDDEFNVETNGILVITAAELLDNDIDADSDPLEILDVGQPELGRLAFNRDNDLVYRPQEGFIGTDSFTYTVTDNNDASATTTGTARITVTKQKLVSLSKTQLVNFVYDETELTEVSKAKVAAIIQQIKEAKDIRIEVYTYTDSAGTDAYNLDLSRRRADALKDLLIRNGISSEDILALGLGESNPIADNETEAGQAINRRGEFIFRAKQPIQ